MLLLHLQAYDIALLVLLSCNMQLSTLLSWWHCACIKEAQKTTSLQLSHRQVVSEVLSSFFQRIMNSMQLPNHLPCSIPFLQLAFWFYVILAPLLTNFACGHPVNIQAETGLSPIHHYYNSSAAPVIGPVIGITIYVTEFWKINHFVVHKTIRIFEFSIK